MKFTESKIIAGQVSEGKTTSFDDIRALPVVHEIKIDDCPEICAAPNVHTGPWYQN